MSTTRSCPALVHTKVQITKGLTAVKRRLVPGCLKAFKNKDVPRAEVLASLGAHQGVQVEGCFAQR